MWWRWIRRVAAKMGTSRPCRWWMLARGCSARSCRSGCGRRSCRGCVRTWRGSTTTRWWRWSGTTMGGGAGVAGDVERGAAVSAGGAGWMVDVGGEQAGDGGAAGCVADESPERFFSKRLLGECRTFVRDERGRAGAASGSHDDLVMSMAMAQSVRAEVLAGAWLERVGAASEMRGLFAARTRVPSAFGREDASVVGWRGRAGGWHECGTRKLRIACT